jgi:large subunit ribosomal protein L27Ae
MRRFHYKRNPDFCPSINVDRLWSMVPEGVYEKAKTDSNMAPVIDVTKLVSPRIFLFMLTFSSFNFL